MSELMVEEAVTWKERGNHPQKQGWQYYDRSIRHQKLSTFPEASDLTSWDPLIH